MRRKEKERVEKMSFALPCCLALQNSDFIPISQRPRTDFVKIMLSSGTLNISVPLCCVVQVRNVPGKLLGKALCNHIFPTVGLCVCPIVAFRRVYGLDFRGIEQLRQSVSNTRMPRFQLSHEDAIFFLGRNESPPMRMTCRIPGLLEVKLMV